MSAQDPFAVLGLAPTRDVAQVKRAYFAAVARHPPQTDPQQFQVIRAAYERLCSAERLAAAYASSPVQLEALGAAYAARFDERVARAAEASRAQAIAGTAVQHFVERFSALPWEGVQSWLDTFRSEAPSRPASEPSQ